MCGSALHLWRESKYTDEKRITFNLNLTSDKETQNQAKWIETHKKWNAKVCSDIVQRQNYRDQLKAWRNVVEWIKLSRKEKSELTDKWNCIKASLALKRWHQRSLLAAKFRARSKTFAEKKRMLYLKSCYAWLRELYHIQKDFCVQMSELSQKFIDKNRLSALLMIKNFAYSKHARFE